MQASSLEFQRIKLIDNPVQAYDNVFYIGSFMNSKVNKLWFCSPVELKSGGINA